MSQSGMQRLRSQISYQLDTSLQLAIDIMSIFSNMQTSASSQ